MKLRQTTTGEIYPYMSGLAARPDMELIHDDEPVAAEIVEEVKAAKAPKAKKKDITDIEFTVSDAPAIEAE